MLHKLQSRWSRRCLHSSLGLHPQQHTNCGIQGVPYEPLFEGVIPTSIQQYSEEERDVLLPKRILVLICAFVSEKNKHLYTLVRCNDLLVCPEVSRNPLGPLHARWAVSGLLVKHDHEPWTNEDSSIVTLTQSRWFKVTECHLSNLKTRKTFFRCEDNSLKFGKMDSTKTFLPIQRKNEMSQSVPIWHSPWSLTVSPLKKWWFQSFETIPFLFGIR